LQTTESSLPHVSRNGVNINYAVGILPNGGGLAPSIIGYNAPKTSSLLHGQTREPIPSEVSKRKRTRSSAIAPSAAKKKATKKQKSIAANDPDEEDIEKAIDEAAAELSETVEETPTINIPIPQQTPPTPIHKTYQPRVYTLQS
jgi:hypothetical protein